MIFRSAFDLTIAINSAGSVRPGASVVFGVKQDFPIQCQPPNLALDIGRREKRRHSTKSVMLRRIWKPDRYGKQRSSIFPVQSAIWLASRLRGATRSPVNHIAGQPQGKRRQGEANPKRFGPRHQPLNHWAKRNCGELADRSGRRFGVKGTKDVSGKIGAARRHDVDDNESAPSAQSVAAFLHERGTSSGPVLIREGDQFDRGGKFWIAIVAQNFDMDVVDFRPFDRDRDARRIGLLTARLGGVTVPRLHIFKRGDIDLERTVSIKKWKRVIPLGQNAAVQEPSDRSRPRAVESPPWMGPAQRRAEVIQERHQ
jgi:hypothetical protein